MRARERLTLGDGDGPGVDERARRDRLARGLGERGEIEPLQGPRLHEEIGAADEVAHALDAERRDEARELRAHRAEEPLELRDRPIELLRLEALEALLRGLGDAFDLGRD